MEKRLETLEVPLGDLVALFEDEARIICGRDEDQARLLAAEALSDFINTYGRDVVVG